VTVGNFGIRTLISLVSCLFPLRLPILLPPYFFLPDSADAPPTRKQHERLVVSPFFFFRSRLPAYTFLEVASLTLSPFPQPRLPGRTANSRQGRTFLFFFPPVPLSLSNTPFPSFFLRCLLLDVKGPFFPPADVGRTLASRYWQTDSASSFPSGYFGCVRLAGAFAALPPLTYSSF